MHPREFCSSAQSARPALELIELARLSADTARVNLRALLLRNPNYFGKITGSSFKAVLRIQEDTSYECLSWVGYNPQDELMEAVITLHQGQGYSISSRRNGSVEYVRFYLSFDDGFSWQDNGLRSALVFDSPGNGSRDHLLTAKIGQARTFCFMRRLPRVRAILSWNAAPPSNAPEWTPVWGNVMEVQIHLDEFSGARLDELVEPGWMNMPAMNGVM